MSSSDDYRTLLSDRSSLRISTLKQWLSKYAIDYSSAIEKSDLIALVEKHGPTIISNNPTSSSSSSSSSSFSSSSSLPSLPSYCYFHSSPCGPLGCNFSLLADFRTEDRSAILCDPGGDNEKIIDLIEKNKLSLKIIIITHAHFDHFLAAFSLSKKYSIKIALHYDDLLLWKGLPLQLQMFGQNAFIKTIPSPLPDPDINLADNHSLPLFNGIVLHTPGHTPGSVCFYFSEINLLLAGDTLFRYSVGRTDLFGGNSDQLIKSIKTILYKLPGNTRVITGHGEETTIEFEMKNNMVIRADNNHDNDAAAKL